MHQTASQKEPEEERKAPPKYARSVTVKDRIFFLRLLWKWSGSIWKMLWIDLLVFIFLHMLVTALHLYLLPFYPDRKKNFERFVIYMQRIASTAPLSFLLGFFVSAVLARRWSICMTIPWMSKPSLLLNTYICPPGQKELARKVRSNLMRYMNLAWIFSMKLQSLQIFNRFQLSGDQHSDFEKFKMIMQNTTLPKKKERRSFCKLKQRLKLINEDPHVKKYFGYLISKKEMDIFLRIADQTDEPDYQGDFWIPLQWCSRILVKARQAGIIIGEFEFSELITMLNEFRSNLSVISTYLDINIPLVYTQVIVIAVYSFFLAEIFSSQAVSTSEVGIVPRSSITNATYTYSMIGFHFVPIFSILKFIFFMGWFKTAASLLNPLGNDSHDIPTSSILDFNLMISNQSGDAPDEIYPMAMHYDGNPKSQLEALDDMTDISWMEELEVEGTPGEGASEGTSLTAETA